MAAGPGGKGMEKRLNLITALLRFDRIIVIVQRDGGRSAGQLVDQSASQLVG